MLCIDSSSKWSVPRDVDRVGGLSRFQSVQDSANADSFGIETTSLVNKWEASETKLIEDN